MIADTGQTPRIAGTHNAGISGNRRQIPDKAMVKDIKVDHGITGLKGETGKYEWKTRRRLRDRFL